MSALTFHQWQGKIDVIMTSVFGLGINCLPDAPYRDWYDEGQTPIEAVTSYVEEVDDTGLMVDIWYPSEEASMVP